MTNENTRKVANKTQLSDNELADVTGGMGKWYDAATGKYYKWTGCFDNDLKYLCPNCGRPLSSFWGFKYTCDHCDASWILEERLVPNYASGLWKEITKEEYDGHGDDHIR